MAARHRASPGSGDIDEAETDIDFSGDPSSWTNGQTFYVDGETCSVATVNARLVAETVTRGLYRSPGGDRTRSHDGQRCHPARAGAIISTTPAASEGRRVWVYAGHAASARRRTASASGPAASRNWRS